MALLKEHESAVVLLDYTLFDFADEDQLLIIAERFSSIHTVTTHRKNIFRKLGINTAHEAVKYALRAGLIDSSEFYI